MEGQEEGKEVAVIRRGGGSVEQYYEWIDSLTPNTLNSLSQAAAAVCGMRIWLRALGFLNPSGMWSD